MGMKLLSHIFCRSSVSLTGDEKVERLHVEGIPDAPMTPEPDGAEDAAEALLNSRANTHRAEVRKPVKEDAPEYYNWLASRLAAAREHEARLALRNVAYCEEQLKHPSFTGDGLSAMAHGLYRHMDAVEREDGELKRRWQHCLAEVTIRQVQTVYG